MTKYRIDVKDSLINAVKDPESHLIINNRSVPDIFSMYCPFCFRVLRTHVRTEVTYKRVLGDEVSLFLQDDPIILTSTCSNCKNKAHIILYAKENYHDMAIIYGKFAGFGTPNSHPAVNYYLDQAQRAHSMGANSAAVAMFRSALEQLMHHEGYPKGMLNQKLQDLQKDLIANTAPAWATKLDTEFLDVIKQLGNTSIHPNDGDITIQDNLDTNLVAALQTTFLEILDLVYEEPARKAARKALLQSAVAKP